MGGLSASKFSLFRFKKHFLKNPKNIEINYKKSRHLPFLTGEIWTPTFSWGWGFPERFGLGGVLCEKCLTKIFNLQRYLGYLKKTLHLNDEFFKNSWLPGGSQTKHSTDYVPGCSYIRFCLDEFVVYLI